PRTPGSRSRRPASRSCRRRSSSSRWPAPACCTARTCSSAASSTWSTWGSSSGPSVALSDRPKPTDILARPQRRSPRMLTEKSDTEQTTHHAPTPGSLDDLICYFEGEWVPMRDAKVSIMTHAFMYGTASFAEIRPYWNPEQTRLSGVKAREHVERLRQPCRIMLMTDVPSVDELTRLIIETVRAHEFPQDAYIRPSFY